MARDPDAIIQEKFAGAGDVGIGDVIITEGWPIAYSTPGGKDPQRLQFNQLYRWLFALGVEINQKGPYLDYDATIDYGVNAGVVASDNRIYKALVPNGPSTIVVDPIGNPTEWFDVFSGLGVSIDDSTLPYTATNVQEAFEAIPDPGSNVRQTNIAGSVDSNGDPDFLSIGAGLSVDLAATAVPVISTAANGWDAEGNAIDIQRVTTADVASAWPGLVDNDTNYLFDRYTGGTWGRIAKILKPIYQRGGTISVVSDQVTFDISAMKSYVGNGVTADEIILVCVGEAVTSAGAVTSVTTYALKGEYRSSVFALAVNTIYTKNHNIGIDDVTVTGEIRFNSANQWMQADTISTTAIIGAIVGNKTHTDCYLETMDDFILAIAWSSASAGGNRTTGEGRITVRRNF